MSLVPLITPASDAEVLTLVSLLQAYGVPVCVRGGGLGALYPVAQTDRYNARTLMVPEELLDHARNVLAAVPEGGAD